MFVIGDFRSFDGLCKKSKLEVPGNGGVGGRLVRGLPARDKLSGVAGPYDPADVLLCCSDLGDLAGAANRISIVVLDILSEITYTFLKARQRL